MIEELAWIKKERATKQEKEIEKLGLKYWKEISKRDMANSLKQKEIDEKVSRYEALELENSKLKQDIEGKDNEIKELNMRLEKLAPFERALKEVST